MAVPSSGFCQMTFEFNLPNANLGNLVLHAAYDLLGGTQNQQLLDLVSDLVVRFTPEIEQAMVASCALTGAEVYVWNAASQLWDNAGFTAYSVSGAVGGSAAPNGSCGLIKATTDNTRVRGKKYIPGPGVVMLGGIGQFITTYTANYLALANQLYDPLTTANGQLSPGVWSRKLLQFFQSNNQFEVNVPASYQRRRRQGVGV